VFSKALGKISSLPLLATGVAGSSWCAPASLHSPFSHGSFLGVVCSQGHLLVGTGVTED
jgi:hypothetical protein